MSQTAHHEALLLEPDPARDTEAGQAQRTGDGDGRGFQPPRGKRLLDLIAAIALLVLAAPLLIVFGILIKLDSRGPALYSQERVGLNRRRTDRRQDRIPVSAEIRKAERRRCHAEGRPFQIYKLRTMVEDAESELGPTWASKDDPRITRIGRFLRATRIDELPQLWNVIRGDMSLVGPRPERPHFVHRFARHIPGYRGRLYAQPGITGLAQVEHRYDANEDDVRRKLDYDLAYMRGYSLTRDIWILVKTAVVMIARRGAH